MSSQPRLFNQTVVAVVLAAATATGQQVFQDSSLTSGIVLLAGQEAVQDDLRVSDPVGGELTRLAEEFRQAADNVNDELGITRYNPATLTAEQRDQYHAQARSINARFVPQVAELLSADQLKRLRQIQFQLPFGAGAHQALVIPNIAATLRLSQDQVSALKALLADYRQKIAAKEPAKAYSPEASKKLIREYDDFRQKLREEYSRQAIELLTENQKATLDELRGAPFDTAKLARN